MRTLTYEHFGGDCHRNRRVIAVLHAVPVIRRVDAWLFRKWPRITPNFYGEYRRPSYCRTIAAFPLVVRRSQYAA